MSMTPEIFSTYYPYLYHMAEIDSWESIKTHGLLCTTALLDLFEIKDGREEIESQRRPKSIEIKHPIYGRAIIRDNKPISDKKLELSLEGMTIKQFYETLNGQVFFWTTLERLNTLLCGRTYKDSKHIVLTVDSMSLLSEFSNNIVLSKINSGAILAPSPRGKGTFVKFSKWPTDIRPKAGGLKAPVIECAVKYGITNIVKHVIKVEEVFRETIIKVIYER